MKSNATTVEDYLAGLPEDRRAAVQAVRETILKNLPAGYEEGIQYGMIGYFVPHSIYPAGYHCDPRQPLPFAGLGSQKNHIGIYLMCIYGDPEQEAWFREAWTKTGNKLDMGKSCVRFKKIENVPLKVVGQAVKRVPVKKYIAHYENALGGGKQATKGVKKKTAKKAATPKKKKAKKKKTVAKKVVKKKAAAKKKAAPVKRKAKTTKKKTAKKK